MKKNKLRLYEAICVVLLVLFIFFTASQNTVSDASFEEVSKATTAVCDLNGLEKRDGLALKKKFSVEAGSFDGFTYYCSDSVMDVRELLVIKVSQDGVARSVTQVLTEYVEEKERIFDGYAPKESELISSHILLNKKGYILFYIGEEREKVVSAFSESL